MTKNETGDVGQRQTDAAFTRLRQNAPCLPALPIGFAETRGTGSFTLTEVVVAAVLMLLSMGLLLSTFVSSRRSVAITQNYLTALKIASSEAERLQTNSYASISNEPTYTTLTNTFIEYQMGRSVATNVFNTYKDIQITVEWTAPASSRRQALTNYMTICNTN